MKKKFAEILCIVVTLCIVFVATFPTASSFLKGDMNGDGKVNSSDALIILQIAVGLIDQPTEDETTDNTMVQGDIENYSKAEVVNYYNKCLKESYAKKLKAKKTETITIVLDSSSAGSIVTNFINNTIIPKYAGTKEYEREFMNGVSDECKLTEFALPYSLTADGAKAAKITKNGSNYVITINVVAETSTLSNPPKYNTMCAHPLDLATVDISPATVTKVDFSYPGTTLTATVDANGKVLSTAIEQPLSATGEGKLGITISAALHGSLEQTVNFIYL